jgi:glycine cleavage system H protein
VKAASDIYAPLTGTITEVNPGIVEDPALVNTQAETTAWFFRMRLADAAAFTELMDKAAYDKFLESL